MKRLFQLIGFICLVSIAISCISFAATYTPGQPNNTYTLNYSANQYGNSTTMTNNLGSGWSTSEGHGFWKFYTGYDVDGYVYADDAHPGSVGNHPWLYSQYAPTPPYTLEFAALLSDASDNRNSLAPQYGLRFAMRFFSAGYGTGQNGIWFGMSRRYIYLTSFSGDGTDGHYGTGASVFNLANYDLYRAAGDNEHSGFTRFRVVDKGGSGDIVMSVKLGDGWWQKTHRLTNVTTTGYTVYNYATRETRNIVVKNGLKMNTGNLELWHHAGEANMKKQTRIADVSLNESYPAASNYVEKPVPSLSSFSLKSATHTVSANVSIGTEEEIYGQVGDTAAKYTARPLTITLKPGRSREAYIAEFTATDNKGYTGQTVAQTIVPERTSTLGHFAGKAQHAAKQTLSSGTSKIRTEQNFLIGVSEGTHAVTTGHHNNGANEDVSTRYYVTVNTQGAETIGAITAKTLGTLNVDASGNLSTASFDIASYILTRIKTNGETSLSYKGDIDKVTVGASTNGALSYSNQSLTNNAYTTNKTAAGTYSETITFTLQDKDGVTIAKDGKITVTYTVPKILSGITLYAKDSANNWSAKVLDQGTVAIHASYTNANSEIVTGSISSGNTNAVVLSGTTATVQSIGTKNAEKTGSCVLSASYTASYNNSVTITKSDTLTVSITAKEFISIVPVESSGNTNLAEKALPDAKANCASTASLGSFSAVSTANGTVTTVGIYTPSQTATGFYSTRMTAYGYNAAGYTVASGTIEAQYMTANAENESFVYDGTAKSITVSVPGDVTVSYGTAEGSYSGTKPTITDVGSLVVYWKMEKAGYSAVTGYATVAVTPKELKPKATVYDKYYNASNAVEEGYVYLETPVSGDDVGVSYESFTFEDAVVGDLKNVRATGLKLTGSDAGNYVLSQDYVQTQASIYLCDMGEVFYVSPYVNVAKADALQNAMREVIPFTLAQNSTFFYDNTGERYGEVAQIASSDAAVGDYARVDDWENALGVLTDTLNVEIRENNIPVIYGIIHITTGTNTVYGDDYVKVNDGYEKSAILSRGGTWTQGANYSASIRTNIERNVSFKVFLREGESIEVGTEIGMYYGRVDVSVSRGASEQARDRIDAFFPVHYDAEKYTVSNMHSTGLQNVINANRGDYLTDVPEFKAPSDGLYDVNIKVTGSSYLLDAVHGLGKQYQGNDPADPPKTTIRYVTIKSE